VLYLNEICDRDVLQQVCKSLTEIGEKGERYFILRSSILFFGSVRGTFHPRLQFVSLNGSTRFARHPWIFCNRCKDTKFPQRTSSTICRSIQLHSFPEAFPTWIYFQTTTTTKRSTMMKHVLLMIVVALQGVTAFQSNPRAGLSQSATRLEAVSRRDLLATTAAALLVTGNPQEAFGADCPPGFVNDGKKCVAEAKSKGASPAPAKKASPAPAKKPPAKKGPPPKLAAGPKKSAPPKKKAPPPKTKSAPPKRKGSPPKLAAGPKNKSAPPKNKAAAPKKKSGPTSCPPGFKKSGDKCVKA